MHEPFAPSSAPTDPVPAAPPTFAGRTTSKTSALRAGLVLGTTLVVAIGTAVVMGASPSPATGAGPRAAASGSAAPDKEPRGNGFGHGGFGPSFGFGPFGGQLANPGGRPDQGLGRGFGQVQIRAIDGTEVALATADGWTRTITLGATTTITRGGAPATAADLHVGDTIRFRQHQESDGTFTIRAVDVVLPTVVGAITKVDGSTLTLTGRDGKTITVHVGDSTAIRVRGVDQAALKDLAAGQVALVSGDRRADGSIDATSVLAGTLRAPRAAKPKDHRPDASEAPEASGQAG
ncbi:MAG TPA: DUF5666 domain-containing protein [Candidatus Limnocylindrales bacterium]|nr:DUF5666 domain-containing protein [Candidatus Limnocylindrales bacterium]